MGWHSHDVSARLRRCVVCRLLRIWNPLFSYYLYYVRYKPIVRFVPRSVAVVLTFSVSGAVHDLCASLVTMRVFVLFAPVFTVFGLLVVVEERFGLSLSWAPVWLRASIHALVLVGTVGVGIVIRQTGL